MPIDTTGWTLPKPSHGGSARKAEAKPHGLKRTPLKRQSIKQTRVTKDGREICSGAEWEKRRQERYDFDKGICQLCFKKVPRKNFHTDHLVHRGMGGSTRDDAISGIRTLHARCHAERHATEEKGKR